MREGNYEKIGVYDIESTPVCDWMERLSACSQHQRMKILLSGDFGQSCFPFCVWQQSAIAFGLQKKKNLYFS